MKTCSHGVCLSTIRYSGLSSFPPIPLWGYSKTMQDDISLPIMALWPITIPILLLSKTDYGPPREYSKLSFGALKNYRENRENGTMEDNPLWERVSGVLFRFSRFFPNKKDALAKNYLNSYVLSNDTLFRVTQEGAIYFCGNGFKGKIGEGLLSGVTEKRFNNNEGISIQFDFNQRTSLEKNIEKTGENYYSFSGDGKFTLDKGDVKINTEEREYIAGIKQKGGFFDYEYRYDPSEREKRWFEEKDLNYITRLLRSGPKTETERADLKEVKTNPKNNSYFTELYAKATKKCKALPWFEKGNELHAKSLYNEAIESYNKALEIFPDDYLVLNAKGDALFKLNCFKEAIFCYEFAQKINPYFINENLGKAIIEEKSCQQINPFEKRTELTVPLLQEEYELDSKKPTAPKKEEVLESPDEVPISKLPSAPNFIPEKQNVNANGFFKDLKSELVGKLQKIYDSKDESETNYIRVIIKYYDKLSMPLKDLIDNIAKRKQQFSSLSSLIHNDELRCPISLDVMRIPVRLPDDKPGDLGALLCHFDTNQKDGKAKCPLTNYDFSPEQIAPNLSVSNKYDSMLEKVSLMQKDLDFN